MVDLAHLLGVAPAVVYTLAFLVAWLESAPAIGLLVPGQTILVGAGFLSGQGKADPFLLAAVVAAGGFCGDLLGFLCGRAWGMAPLHRLPGRLRLTDSGRDRLVNLFSTHGGKAIVLARFQPIGRAFGPYLAGATGMHAPRFLAATAVASVLAAGGLIGLGYIAGLGFSRLSQQIGFTVVAAVTVLLGAVVYVGIRVSKKGLEGREEPPIGPL